MSLNIQTSTGLLEIGGKVTKEKVISALGYEPADKEVETTVDTHTKDTNIHVTSDERKLWNNKSDFSGDYNDLENAPDILEDSSGDLSVTDESGNVIVRVDENGLHTTEVEAKGIMLGQTLSEHTVNSTVHVTSEEKQKWNNKSDFSGNYEDLVDKPNITEDSESKELTIVDNSGNTIARFDENGLETTQVKAKTVLINEVDVQSKLDEIQGDIEDIGDALDEHEKDADVHITSEERTKWNNKAAQSDLNAHTSDTVVHISSSERTKWNTVTEVSSNLDKHKDDTISHITSDERTKWDSKSDFSGNYIDLVGEPNITENESAELTIVDNAGNTIANFDENGLETTTVTAKEIVVNGVDVKAKLDEHTTDIGSNLSAISELKKRLNALADSDDITLDQLSEIVAYIKSNKELIDAITTSKVSVADIVNNLTTAVANKPLSANQGVAIKALIDELRSDLNSCSTAINTHSTNGNIHIDASERTKWNNTTSTLSTHTADKNIHITASERNSWNDRINALQTSTDEHIGNANIHVTTNDKTRWNAKSDFSGDYHDLSNLPNITDDKTAEYNICDSNGNIIATFNANGLRTINAILGEGSNTNDLNFILSTYILNFDYSQLEFDTTKIV